MSETLVELSKKLLNGISSEVEVEPERFSKRTLDKDFEMIKKQTQKKNRILVFGINPAGGRDEAKQKEYYEYILDEDLQNELTKEETNANYFKSNYELFDKEITTMTWILKDENVLNERFSNDQYFKCNEVIKKEKEKENIIIFCDLVYYHDTNSNTIKKCISKNYISNLDEIRKLKFKKDEDLVTNVKKIVNKHIKILDPKLIVVTNAFASQLICGALGNENDRDSSYILYKDKEFPDKKIPILFGGMVSGGHTMDIFSKNRLKREISEVMKNF